MASISIPRGLERYPLGDKLDGEIQRWNATDRERSRDVVVTRVRFAPADRAERDALVARVRALYSVGAPSLIAAVDAGDWEDDAFVVEERVVDPQPLGAMDLDEREKALAARALAEGVAALHEAGWSLDALDVVVDAYRQPKIAIAQQAVRATDSTRASDLSRLRTVLESLVPAAPDASSAAELARAIRLPEAPASSPLVHASAPSRAPVLVALIALGVLALIALFLAR